MFLPWNETRCETSTICKSAAGSFWTEINGAKRENSISTPFAIYCAENGSEDLWRCFCCCGSRRSFGSHSVSSPSAAIFFFFHNFLHCLSLFLSYLSFAMKNLCCNNEIATGHFVEGASSAKDLGRMAQLFTTQSNRLFCVLTKRGICFCWYHHEFSPAANRSQDWAKYSLCDQRTIRANYPRTCKKQQWNQQFP